MVKQFLNDFLFPVLGWTLCGIVGTLIVFWLVDVISSISRAADALERIADAQEDIADELEDDDEGDDNDDETKGGAE